MCAKPGCECAYIGHQVLTLRGTSTVSAGALISTLSFFTSSAVGAVKAHGGSPLACPCADARSGICRLTSEEQAWTGNRVS